MKMVLTYISLNVNTALLIISFVTGLLEIDRVARFERPLVRLSNPVYFPSQSVRN